jgi:hypothetical protein
MALRWKADPGVTSATWLVRMVPSLLLSADVEGASTILTASSQGSDPGDRVEVLRHVAGRTALVRRARVDASGTVQVSVMTPRRRAAYVVRLLPTTGHAATSARVVVSPPAPAAVTISGASSRVAAGGTTVISGVVTSPAGAVLPGRRVVLLRHGALRWQPVGHATTDSEGRVSMTTPAVEATSGFRLRTGNGVRSAVWRVVELPVLSASAQTSGATVTISANATGGRPGDTVVLLRRTATGLVRLRHASLDAEGSVTFTVAARRRATTYAVRLPATRRHGAATTSVTVPGTG